MSELRKETERLIKELEELLDRIALIESGKYVCPICGRRAEEILEIQHLYSCKFSILSQHWRDK